MHYPQVILGSIALFFYVGVEVIAGDTIGQLGGKLNVTNFTSLTSYTMAFMVAGYLIGITCIPKYISQAQALIGSAIAGMLFVSGVMMANPASSAVSEILWGWTMIATIPDPVAYVALLGFANALVWPAVWPLALEGLGKYTAQGSALLVMGIAGGAILPLLFGKISHNTGDIQNAYWVALPCYAFILYYAISGHKLRTWRK